MRQFALSTGNDLNNILDKDEHGVDTGHMGVFKGMPKGMGKGDPR